LIGFVAGAARLQLTSDPLERFANEPVEQQSERYRDQGSAHCDDSMVSMPEPVVNPWENEQ